MFRLTPQRDDTNVILSECDTLDRHSEQSEESQDCTLSHQVCEMFRLTPQHDVICHSERGTKFHKLIRYAKTAVICLALSLFVTLPVFADTVPVPTLGENSAYTLTKVDQAGENTITKYEWSDKENKLIPVYYRVDLNKTEYGNPNGDKTLILGWEKNADGNLEFKKDPANPVGQTITYKYNSSDAQTRLTNSTDNSSKTTTGVFIGQTTGSTSGNQYGGAIYNNGSSAKLGDINADFIGNYVSGFYVKGGAIYNNYGTIGNIAGDFIGNYAQGYYAYGGAIYNNGGTIGNITGNFIGNYVSSKGDGLSGGAIYNSGTIGDITGDFIGNYSSVGHKTDGGAIYNGGTIGNITGDFIGNYSDRFGGAISNGGIIRNITGNFIYNHASSTGGAIYNSGTIGNITGDFIGNYAVDGGAIYNSGTIGNITGDFIGNYSYSSGNIAEGGAIMNTSSSSITNITGNFINNYADAYRYAIGGAVYNSSIIENINANFVNNYVHSFGRGLGSDEYVIGGAIYNSGNISNISGQFINNYAHSSGSNIYVAGGAIANITTIGNITAEFINNYVISGPGGAILNMGRYHDATIDNINSRFINNYASYGGAIANKYFRYDEEDTSRINNIQSDFINNHAVFSGGAIYNFGSTSLISVIGNLNSNFIENYSGSAGGAIYNYGVIESIASNFVGNYVKGENNARGGAIYTQGIIGKKDEFGNLSGGIINSNFIGNYVTTTAEDGVAAGGAIWTNADLNIIAQDGGKSVFSGNYTEVNGVKTSEAIYIETAQNRGRSNINITSVDNNKVTYNKITEVNAPDFNPTLSLKANTNGVIIIDDQINGNISTAGTTTVKETGDLVIDSNYQNSYNVSNISEFIEYVKANPTKFWWYEEDMTNENIVTDLINRGYVDINNEQTISTTTEEDNYSYTLALDGDDTGAIYLNNKIINANISVDNTNVYVNEASNLAESRSLAVNSGILNINHLANQNINYERFSNNGTINLASVDVDLANESMGRITAQTYGESNGKINVQGLNLLSDATKDTTSILFADEPIAGSVTYTGVSPIAYSPIYKYEVSYNPEDGFFTFLRGGGTSNNASDAFNPAVLAPSVATQAGAYTTQLQTFNYAFQHADTFMNIPYLERVAMKNTGRYAVSPTGEATDVGTFSPLLTKEDTSGFWVKPYASFENIPLNNGPKVSNINYGTLVGYDSSLTPVAKGWERVLTGYIGYNGASQRYSGVDAYQNGGILGGTATLYKGNFFNATTLSVGATAGDASTMYGNENYAMLLAGIGNKTGYNFEFKDGRIILQPNFLISYTFVNTFDYTNGAGVRIKSDPLNAIQLAPGLKLIGNTKNGWQPYLSVAMVWNLLDDSKVTANDVRLPEMSIDPYIQYGAGIQKRFKDRFIAFGQAMIHNGGRNGVSLTGGLRWSVGK